MPAPPLVRPSALPRRDAERVPLHRRSVMDNRREHRQVSGHRPSPPTCALAAPDLRLRRGAAAQRGFSSHHGRTRRIHNSVGEALLEGLETRQPLHPDTSLISDDLAPTPLDQRTFTRWDVAALWVGLVVCVPSYLLASNALAVGMSWWQAVACIVVANFIVLIPLILNGHAGTKYGVPFPVLARASFGVRGAHVPSLLRALVACGWFGIQTWVGGEAIHTLVNTATEGALAAAVVPELGITIPQLACFAAFWAVQVAIIVRGVECISAMENYAAPVLIALTVGLLIWAYTAAGGFGPILSAPSQFVAGGARHGEFWRQFWPLLTACVGFWGTLALNIADFTRYAKSQEEQMTGQAMGLPFFMGGFSMIAIVVTSATVAIFGVVIADPIALLNRIGGTGTTMLAIAGLLLSTLTTNIAANVVGPANAVVNLSPGRVNFATGGLLTAIIGAGIMPWKLLADGAMMNWVIATTLALGPLTGIFIVDYFWLRRRRLDVDALYSSDPGGLYWYTHGFNLRAIAALVLGIVPNLPGFLQTVAWPPNSVHPVFIGLYDFSWFVGVATASIAYMAMCRMRPIKACMAA